MTSINQEELVEAWCRKLGLENPSPKVLAAIGARVAVITGLRREQFQLVTKLATLTNTKPKRVFVWLKEDIDGLWSDDLSEADLRNRIEVLKENIAEVEEQDTESIAEPQLEPV